MKTMSGIALLALAGAAFAAPGKGASKADEGHRAVDGRPLVMIGQGARVKDGDKLYDMQMWIDEEDARRAFPALAMRASGRDKAHLTRGDHGPAFLVWGRFTKQAVFKFARAVPAATLKEDVKAALAEERDVKDEKVPETLAALFDVDADAGDEWVLTTWDDGRVELRTGGGKDDVKKAPQSPKLERALWNVWLGAKPVSMELRRALIERLDALGR